MDTILLIKPGSLGDVIHALPVVSAIKAAHPQARVTWVIDPRWQPVIAGNPAVDGSLPFPREEFRGLLGIAKGIGWYAKLTGLRPSVAVDLQCLMRSALIAVASRAKSRIGLSDAREGARHLYQNVADVAGVRHAVDRYLTILPLLDVAVPAEPEFFIQPGEPVAEFNETDFVLIHPYARGSGKSLTVPQVQKLCDLVAPRRIIVAGVGTPLADPPKNVSDFTNRTSLAQLIWLIRRARAVISVDSGPMHLAAAIGTALLSIHTWSDPRKVGPYSTKATIWQGGEIRPQRLDARATIRPEKPIRDGDLEAIAAWAQSPA